MKVEMMGVQTMKAGKKFAIGLAMALVLTAQAAMAAPAESATARDVSGTVSLVTKGKSAALAADSQIAAGDVLRLEAGSKATVKFEDGGSLALVGPAEVTFIEMADTGRRVRLESGTIASADIRGVATRALRTGDRVRLDGNRGVVEVLERATPEPHA